MFTSTARSMTVLFVAATLLAGCQSGPADDGVATAVPILHTVEGNDPALTEIGAWLINSRADLDGIGSADLSALDVDFASESLVLLTLGQRSTAGYRIDITGVSIDGGDLYVHGNAHKPPAGAMTAQVLTFPYAAAVIPRTQARRVIPDVN